MLVRSRHVREEKRRKLTSNNHLLPVSQQNSSLGRLSKANAMVAVANTWTAIGVLVAHRIGFFAARNNGRTSDTDAMIAVTHTGTTVGVLVADGISLFITGKHGRVSDTDAMITVANARTTVGVLVANGIRRFRSLNKGGRILVRSV